jgi:hypothetical protein
MTATIDLAQGDVRLLDTDLAQRLLAANLPARLAFTAADGTPRVLPINFWWNGSEVVMTGFATSKKARMLRARPEVAITIDTNAAPPEVLLIRGRASGIRRVTADLGNTWVTRRVPANMPIASPPAANATDTAPESGPKTRRGGQAFRTRYPEGTPEWMKGPSDAAAHPAHEETI